MDCTDPKLVSKIKNICYICLAVLFVVDLALYFATDWYAHPHFDESKFNLDKFSFAFYPIFGFVACWLMVVGSKKIVSQVFKRKDTYYHD